MDNDEATEVTCGDSLKSSSKSDEKPSKDLINAGQSISSNGNIEANLNQKAQTSEKLADSSNEASSNTSQFAEENATLKTAVSPNLAETKDKIDLDISSEDFVLKYESEEDNNQTELNKSIDSKASGDVMDIDIGNDNVNTKIIETRTELKTNETKQVSSENVLTISKVSLSNLNRNDIEKADQHESEEEMSLDDVIASLDEEIKISDKSSLSEVEKIENKEPKDQKMESIKGSNDASDLATSKMNVIPNQPDEKGDEAIDPSMDYVLDGVALENVSVTKKEESDMKTVLVESLETKLIYEKDKNLPDKDITDVEKTVMDTSEENNPKIISSETSTELAKNDTTLIHKVASVFGSTDTQFVEQPSLKFIEDESMKLHDKLGSTIEELEKVVTEVEHVPQIDTDMIVDPVESDIALKELSSEMAAVATDAINDKSSAKTIEETMIQKPEILKKLIIDDKVESTNNAESTSMKFIAEKLVSITKNTDIMEVTQDVLNIEEKSQNSAVIVENMSEKIFVDVPITTIVTDIPKITEVTSKTVEVTCVSPEPENCSSTLKDTSERSEKTMSSTEISESISEKLDIPIKCDDNQPNTKDTAKILDANQDKITEEKLTPASQMIVTQEHKPKPNENVKDITETSLENGSPTTSQVICLTSKPDDGLPSDSVTPKSSEVKASMPQIVDVLESALPSTSADPTTSTLPSTLAVPSTTADPSTLADASTSADPSDQMVPDFSEIPEVTDSLGLLAESCRTMDDQDVEDEEPDPDDDDDEDDEECSDHDDESNPTPMDHSEDSNNAQSSETDQIKEQATEPIKSLTDNKTEVIASPIDEAMDVQLDTTGDDVAVDTVNIPPIDEIPIPEIVTVESKKDEETTENLDKKISLDTNILQSILVTAKGNKTPTKTPAVEESPSKTNKLQISQSNVFINYVDLEESSSEDDVQITNKTTDEVSNKTEVLTDAVTINLPKEIDVMSTSSVGTSEIVSKEGEVAITGIPKPAVAKVARLNTGEITIKTATSTETPLVIPETKMGAEEEPTEITELIQEVFNLDSDEDKEKESKSQKSKKSSAKSKELGRCVNPRCREALPGALPAEPAILRFFEVKKKKKQPAMVCVQCANDVATRMQDLLEGVKSLKPLLDLNLEKCVSELVEISDSDTDSDRDAAQPPLGLRAARFLETDLEEMINSTWKKYDLEERLRSAQEKIDSEVDRLEKESKEIDDMLNLCQSETDRVRREFYATFARRTSSVPPFIIVDTPQMKYSFIKENDDNDLGPPQTRALSKRTRPSFDDPPAKRAAIPLGFPSKDDEPNQSNTSMDSKDDDNTEVKVVKLSAEAAPLGLPGPGELTRPGLQAGDAVRAARGPGANWTRGEVLFVLQRAGGGTPFTQCRIKFLHKVKAQVKNLSCRHIAYGEPANVRLTIGTRVIALFKDPTNLQKRDVFYPGVVAEMPNPVNNYRYLVFFDDGYAQYVTHENTRVVVESSTLVWDEVDPLSRDFVRNYLLAYPERPMVRLHAGQKLKTEWKGKWWLSTVLQVDASLVNVHFEADNRTEWIYRGSTRLAPLYLELQAAERHRSRALPRSTGNSKPRGLDMPYVEYTRSDETSKEDAEREKREQEELKRQRAVAKKSTAAPPDAAVMSRVVYYTPKAAVKPYKMTPHNCSPRCKRSDVLPLKELRTYNPLARPLLSGWERQIVRFRFRREIMYRAPCGRRLRSMRELHRYLRATQSEMSVDLFDFGVNTHCLAEFVLNRCIVSKKDLSHGKENVPVPCVNYYDTSLPEFCSYNTERTPTAGVPLNLDPEFLCGCDCTDDCRDKTKCACWKLTLEGARTIGMEGDVGYVYKRLQEPVPSGIYECNSRCKCKQTCLNRVAQHPLQLKLQVFKTQNRGWGIRALNDVPKGSFLCVYAGNLLTDATANLDGLNEGDEYLAELDYIEVVEQMKEGYEADIPDKDKELDRKESNKSSSESSSESEDDERPSKDETEDGDFKPDFEPGVDTFNKRLRRREKKKEKEEQKQKKEEDCITISDDEELREPSTFMAQAGMGDSEFISKYRSVRAHFGKDEACYIMDAKVQGNIGRYLNHSCTPNVFVQNVFVDTHDPRFPWVAFFALALVKAGTELTWNYNYDIGSVPNKVLYCYCGAPNCRGRLL